MITILCLCFVGFAVAPILPLSLLLLQAIAAILPLRENKAFAGAFRPNIAVIIPAHNEALSIQGTIKNVQGQIASHDRIIVVADNCTDETASIARDCGAEIVVREDPDHVGKGYALDAGLRHLTVTGPSQVVVVLDADCRFGPNALAILARTCGRYQVPVQSMNLQISNIVLPTSENRSARLVEFAWRIQCSLRKTGFMRLGFPCPLMGTGMAFPWSVLKDRSLATGHLSEDLVLGIELTLLGKPPRFCPHAIVISEMPPTDNGRLYQRERWIHGYLSTVREYLLKLLRAAMLRRDIGIFALACDLAVPPLSAIILWCIASLLLSFLWYVATGAVAPILFSVLANAIFACFLVIAWIYCGRGLLEWKEFAAVPWHLATVARIIINYIAGRRAKWTRAERGQ
jgi:cellulose synthase/poly-beta-1,6-N-acetylglucosamine synthase-like glycosyltransferase